MISPTIFGLVADFPERTSVFTRFQHFQDSNTVMPSINSDNIVLTLDNNIDNGFSSKTVQIKYLESQSQRLETWNDQMGSISYLKLNILFSEAVHI